MSKNYREGELKAIELLLKNGYSVKDESCNPNYFEKDIDLIAEKNNEKISVEVKWDNRISDTGNMYVELETNRDLNEKGWFCFCEADLLFYGDSKANKFYIFKLDDLRHYIQEYGYKTQKRRAADWNSKGKLRKVSEGYIVPINDFCKKYPVSEADV